MTIAPPQMPPVDPRSFHAFEFRGSKLLFDRSTSVTMSLNDLAFETLQLVESQGLETALASVAQRHPDIDTQDLRDVLDEMTQQGMFRFLPIDTTAQDAFLESLWKHQPYRIQMLMAQGCNLGCRYCYAWRNGSNQKHTLMPFDVARQTVDYLVWRSGGRPELQVTFFGGEPLLNYEVVKQVVEYCRGIEKLGKKRFVFELCTNATLMDRDVTDFLVREKFLLFMSIDGWREMHNYNRPSMDKDDLYDTIVANARYANEQYKLHNLTPPKVRANLTNQFTDFRGVGEYLSSLGFTKIDVGAIEPLPHGDASPAAITEDQADQLQAQCEQMIADGLEMVAAGKPMTAHHRRVFHDITEPPTKVASIGVTCGIGRNTLVVDNKGNLFPCHRYEGMESYILGNVFTGLDRETTMAYYRRLNRHATAHCGDCWIRDYCGGGCVWLLSAKNGHIADPTERECRRRRRSMELRIWARSQLRTVAPGRFTPEYGEVSLDVWPGDEPTAQTAATKRVTLPILA